MNTRAFMISQFIGGFIDNNLDNQCDENLLTVMEIYWDVEVVYWEA